MVRYIRENKGLDNDTLKKWKNFMQDRLDNWHAKKVNDYTFMLKDKNCYEYIELNKDGSVTVTDIYGDHDKDEQNFDTLNDLLDCYTGGDLDDFDEI